MKINVNGINIHYKEYGEGKPIILLHGNGESYEIFDVLIEKLQLNYKIYAVDSRCHGESDNTEEISYDLMANDMIEFIKKLKIDKPIFYGFSDGGIIGLLIAIQEPELLANLIISGAQLNPAGGTAWCNFLDKVGYFFTRSKLIKLMIDEPDIKVEELNRIAIPVHVIAGEKDIIRREHTKLIADNIKNSTLEIVPKENHGSYIIHSDKIYEILKKYI